MIDSGNINVIDGSWLKLCGPASNPPITLTPSLRHYYSLSLASLQASLGGKALNFTHGKHKLLGRRSRHTGHIHYGSQYSLR